MADRSGYIGRAPGDSSVVIARQSFEPTGIQTNFTFSSGYTVGYLDAYFNGVRLIEANDYTATDGSTVGLTTYAVSGDVLEFVAYKAFNAANVTDATGNFSVGNDLTVSGNVTISGITTLGAGSSVSYATTSFGLDGTPDVTVSDITGNNLTIGYGTVTSDLSVTGNVTVGGTLTYENLTNQDVLGLATYRSGLNVGSTEGSGAGVAVTITPYGNAYFGRTGVVTATSFTGSLTGNVTGDATGLSGTPNIIVGTITAGTPVTVGSAVTISGGDGGIFNQSGITTLGGNTYVGSAITMYASAGIVSATSFYGDGSNLEGVSSSGGAVLDITACLFI